MLLVFGICLFIFVHIFLSQDVDYAQKTINSTAKSLPEKLTEFITIKAVGDMIPGTNYPDYRLPSNPNELFPKSVRQKLQGSDILFGNFESTLTNYPTSSKDINQGQVFAFRSPPKYAQIFADIKFKVLNIANNHTMDFTLRGFQDTKKSINAVGIKVVGEKNQVLYLNVNEVKIAMVGFCFYDYCNSVNDIAAAKALIAEAKSQAKIVVVSMHVGAEGTNALHVKNKTEFFYGENRGNSIDFARTMIDTGADLILGHGPHVPRAMEIYKGKLIAYSLGNFLGYRTLSINAETGYSMILEVKLNPTGDFVSGRVIPVYLDKQGIPHIDKRFQTTKLLRSLIKSDFPNSLVTINNQGEILGNSKK
jgi:hypothetical protein